jgi:hypothetical protein
MQGVVLVGIGLILRGGGEWCNRPVPRLAQLSTTSNQAVAVKGRLLAGQRTSLIDPLLPVVR